MLLSSSTISVCSVRREGRGRGEGGEREGRGRGEGGEREGRGEEGERGRGEEGERGRGGEGGWVGVPLKSGLSFASSAQHLFIRLLNGAGHVGGITGRRPVYATCAAAWYYY